MSAPAGIAAWPSRLKPLPAPVSPYQWSPVVPICRCTTYPGTTRSPRFPTRLSGRQVRGLPLHFGFVGVDAYLALTLSSSFSFGFVVLVFFVSDFKPALAAVAWVSPESRRH